MAATADTISVAFAGDPNLKKRIFDAINETPQHATLFEDIATYQLVSQQFSISSKGSSSGEQPLKKRKLEGDATTGSGPQPEQLRTVILEARDISFSLPQRKKLHLSIVQYGTDFDGLNTTFALCARSPTSSEVEFEYPLTAFPYIFRVPVPEKIQKQYNFCLLSQQESSTANLIENILWTINQGPLKSCQVHSEALNSIVGDENVLEAALDAVLKRSNNKLTYPSKEEFASVLVESHRKGDTSYHVKAFRGSKEGYLFFLENGIFFGFKKPVTFFPFHEIDSVSYTAVLQRTFNLVVTVQAAGGGDNQEIEFSMLDQADFAGIDEYIKKHQLQDASMAEARRAKQYKVNGLANSVIEGQDENEQTELQKAQQELEDEEDEMEEDYEPGSEGESEGSGSSDEDDEYQDKRRSDSRDLVKDELGSEAEDVEISEEEEEEEDREDGDDDDNDEEDEADEERGQEVRAQHATAVKQTSSFAISPEQGMPGFDDEDQL